MTKREAPLWVGGLGFLIMGGSFLATSHTVLGAAFVALGLGVIGRSFVGRAN